MNQIQPMPTLRDQLAELVARGLTFADCVHEFRAKGGDEHAYVAAARERWCRGEGEIEIDGEAVVSVGADPGAYVLAWLWVPALDIWDGAVDSDGQPCMVRNHYYCSECAETWVDDWSCACNDKCPVCDHEIEPDESVDLSVAGEEIR